MDYFSVKAVQNLTGVNSNTLKAWERRYNAVVPSRQENGRRLYSKEDLLRIRLLNQLIGQGHSIASIANKSTDELRNLLNAVNEVSGLYFAGDSVDEHSKIRASQRARIFEYLKVYDIDSISLMFSGIRSQTSASHFILNDAVPLIEEVGALVEQGELTIAQEHTISALLKAELMHLLYSMTHSLKDLHIGSRSSVATVSGLEGDIHEFGILSAAILVACHGGKPIYLGPNLPAQALIQAAKNIKPDLILIGSTKLDPGTLAVPIGPYIESVVSEIGSSSDIWLGGWLDSNLSAKINSKRVKHVPLLNLLPKALSEFNR